MISTPQGRFSIWSLQSLSSVFLVMNEEPELWGSEFLEDQLLPPDFSSSQVRLRWLCECTGQCGLKPHTSYEQNHHPSHSFIVFKRTISKVAYTQTPAQLSSLAFSLVLTDPIHFQTELQTWHNDQKPRQLWESPWQFLIPARMPGLISYLSISCWLFCGFTLAFFIYCGYQCCMIHML